ncbi:hypothetical protein AB0L00_25245 [Actinoallomurus sp. NPDC052308]|uniref:hypothetical protein n=1 Tax=Actinoallomurus sp. NPDC052308 TaxID=3155530 RepID=UPI0034453BFD
MTEILSSTIARLRGLADIYPGRDNLSIYIFGSVTHGSKRPNDIDILIVYSTGNFDLAHELATHFRRLDVYPSIEVLALSRDEERETDFIRTVQAVEVWPKSHPMSGFVEGPALGYR